MTTHEVVNGKSVVEDLEFADYDSLADSCADYAWLITIATQGVAVIFGYYSVFSNFLHSRLPALLARGSGGATTQF